MGATEKVFVEQLVSRHSIEELIVLMNKRDESKSMLYANTDELKEFQSEYYGNNILSKEDIDGNNKVRFLLSNVKLIKPDQKKNRKRQISNDTSVRRKAKSVRFNVPGDP